MANRANRDAYEAVAEAVRLHGHKRGWHLAAQRLGVSERTARAIANGESSGATICPDRALAAHLDFLTARLTAWRAETERLEAQCAQVSGALRRASSAAAPGSASMPRDAALIKQGS
jgi:type II secretory pathway component PulM